MYEIKEILKNKLISIQFVEEEIMLDVKYVNEGTEPMMLIDNGAPKLIVSFTRLEGYLQDAKISKENVERRNCAKRFRMGKTIYISDTEVTFSVVMMIADKD